VGVSRGNGLVATVFR